MTIRRLLIINNLVLMPPAEELYAENLALKAELANLQAQVAWFQRQMFGARSEKLPVNEPGQIKLGLPETPPPERPKQTVTYQRRTVAAEKRPIPAEVFANVPVAETIELVPDEVQAEPDAFEQISEERTFEVELIGPKLVKREIVRPKYRRKADRDQAPVMAAALPRVVAGGYASAGLIAYIVTSKHQHHLLSYAVIGIERPMAGPGLCRVA